MEGDKETISRLSAAAGAAVGPVKEAKRCCLAEGQRQFINLWGEMAQHWGISRTMAQVHALNRIFSHVGGEQPGNLAKMVKAFEQML